MSPSDKDYILHPGNSYSKLSDPGEPRVNVLDHPLAKISESYGVLALGFCWKG